MIMITVFLVFCAIWLVLTGLGTFVGYVILAGSIPLIRIAVYACLISWIIAMIVTILFSVSKSEIARVQKEEEERAKYRRFPGGAANHYVGIETINGVLHFFPDRLVFHAHSFREEIEDWELAYADISAVRLGEDEDKHKLCIEGKNGTVNKFSTFDNEKLLAGIREKLNRDTGAV